MIISDDNIADNLDDFQREKRRREVDPYIPPYCLEFYNYAAQNSSVHSLATHIFGRAFADPPYTSHKLISYSHIGSLEFAAQDLRLLPFLDTRELAGVAHSNALPPLAVTVLWHSRTLTAGGI